MAMSGVQYSTVQYSAVQYRTVQYSTVSLLTDEALRPYVYVCLISDDGHVGGADHQRQHPHAEDGQQTLPGRHARAQRVQDAHVPAIRKIITCL